MIATVNPCGFAMLPAYLSYFLGLETGVQSAWRNVARPSPSARCSPSASSPSSACRHHPRAVHTVVQEVHAARDDRHRCRCWSCWAWPCCTGSSRSCDFPGSTGGGQPRAAVDVPVRRVVRGRVVGVHHRDVRGRGGADVREENVVSGCRAFVVYGLGMGTVVVFLTVATALAKTSLLKSCAACCPTCTALQESCWTTGLYLAYYGWYASARARGRVTTIRSSVSSNARPTHRAGSRVGPMRLGLIMTVLIGGVITMAYFWRRPSTPIVTMSPFRENLARDGVVEASTSADRSGSSPSTAAPSNG